MKQNGIPKGTDELPKPPSKRRDHRDLRDDAPPRKKAKSATGGFVNAGADDDAAFAARLQAEENNLARSTRGGGTAKRQSAGNQPKKKGKSATKIKADDDSDLEAGSGEEKIVKRTGAFHVCILACVSHDQL